jgi:hypothetical protein
MAHNGPREGVDATTTAADNSSSQYRINAEEPIPQQDPPQPDSKQKNNEDDGNREISINSEIVSTDVRAVAQVHNHATKIGGSEQHSVPRKRAFNLSSLASMLWESPSTKSSTNERSRNGNNDNSPFEASQNDGDASRSQGLQPQAEATHVYRGEKVGDAVDNGGNQAPRASRLQRHQSSQREPFDVHAQSTTFGIPLSQPPSEKLGGDMFGYISHTLELIFGNLDDALEMKTNNSLAGAVGQIPPSFEVYAKPCKGKKWLNALLLIQATNTVPGMYDESQGGGVDVHYAEQQLTVDSGRTSALTAVCNVEQIRFARTVRSSTSRTGFKTTFSPLFPFVVVEEDQFQVSKECLDAFRGVVDQTYSICTSTRLARYGYSFVSNLGTGSTAVVFEVVKSSPAQDASNEPLVAKIVDFSHCEPFEAERDILSVLAVKSGDEEVIEGISQLREVVPQLQMIITSPVGTSLNKLPWGSIRSGVLFVRIVSALKSLSRRGVIHRDVSPGNLVLDENSKLFLTDFGMATMHEHEGQTYSGSKFFASDAVCRVLDEHWHQSKIKFGYLDDLESLLKCVLWTLDFECNNIINRAAKENGGKIARKPKDILSIWSTVWKTSVGKRFKHVISTMRRKDDSTEDPHNYVASWLEGLGWTQNWVGL